MTEAVVADRKRSENPVAPCGPVSPITPMTVLTVRVEMDATEVNRLGVRRVLAKVAV